MNRTGHAQQTDATSLVTSQRGANALDIVSLPKMTTTAGRDANFLIGGNFPVPTVDAPGNPDRNGNRNGKGLDPVAPERTAPKNEFGLTA